MKIGDKVWTTVFVCGEQKKSYLGIVTAISDDGSVCNVDVGTLHGASAWNRFEATSSLIRCEE